MPFQTAESQVLSRCKEAGHLVHAIAGAAVELKGGVLALQADMQGCTALDFIGYGTSLTAQGATVWGSVPYSGLSVKIDTLARLRSCNLICPPAQDRGGQGRTGIEVAAVEAAERSTLVQLVR